MRKIIPQNSDLLRTSALQQVHTDHCCLILFFIWFRMEFIYLAFTHISGGVTTGKIRSLLSCPSSVERYYFPLLVQNEGKASESPEKQSIQQRRNYRTHDDAGSSSGSSSEDDEPKGERILSRFLFWFFVLLTAISVMLLRIYSLKYKF